MPERSPSLTRTYKIPQTVDRHVVMFSGGIGSWAAAKRVAERHGTSTLTLLFTDTLIEDADLYRFLVDAAENVGAKLARIGSDTMAGIS
jgi:3'-phosphoadenosine 5'-phosphosulfate sulfotransferase (PAPS reductase)/FAD synthetase